MNNLKQHLTKLLLASLFVSNSIAFAKVIRVGASLPVKDISQAITFAKAYDTVLVEKNTYFINNITIDKPLIIKGLNFPLLDGKLKGEIFIVKSDNVLIEGFSFQNVGQTSTIDWAAVKVLEAKNVRVRGNIIKNSYFGIYLSACNNCFVEKNIVVGNPKEEQNTGNGIHAWKCDSIQILNNHVSGHRDGIYFEFVTNSLIQGNFSQHNIRYGLHFMFSHNDHYFSNTFKENGAGVAVMYSKHVLMINNKFIENWGAAAYGILLKDIDDSIIEQNIFKKNTVGIYMEGTNRMKVTKNVFTENGWAMRIQANCNENVCSFNNFSGNTFDIATNGNTVFNTFENNYWDKYEGYDLNKDKIGDVPYHPVSLFSTVCEQMPHGIVLLRSFIVTLMERAEKIIPSLTPENLIDKHPLMKPVS